MAFGFCIGVALLLSLWSRAETAGIPDGVLRMECHDRYFMIAVDPSFTGDEPHFEAVDETGAYAITRQYAAQCGYSINVHPLPGHVELRASYFSCQTQNKDDEMFTFNFNLNVTQEGKEVTYPLNKTCSPSLPWSPREVTCETNYMEVSVRSEVTCPSGTKKDDWNSLKPAHRSTTSDWQVMFQTDDVQLPPMNISDARKQGYVFLLTEGRLVFRAPYGQPDSFSTEVNGVPVEAVHATIFSRQSWVVLMVDFVAACSMDEGLYHESGYMMWETPEMLYPNLDGQQVNVGLKGELVAQPVAEERGYIVGKQNNTIQICIPENAEGRYRKSAVDEDLYEFYVYHLYLEQILVDEDRVETRIRFLRTLATPLLPSPIFAENQTVLEENMFTVYLGDVPEDVQPVVLQQFSKTDAVLHYILNINYTLTVLPEKDLYYHMESVVALVTDVSPPQFDAVCTESGISFKLDHRPFDYLWEITIDSDLLTSELADQHGYIMSNDSNIQEHILEGIFGTFEIIMRDLETSEVQGSTIKTCLFSTTELIMCSTDGRMTVVADLALAIPNGNPARTNLRDKYCGPKETDGSRALFSFSLNSCGSAIKLNSENVIYQNEIFYSKKFLRPGKVVSDNATERVTMQCTYPLSGLHRLFSVYRFESDAAGIGSLLHTTHPAAGLQNPTIQPTSAYNHALQPRYNHLLQPRLLQPRLLQPRLLPQDELQYHTSLPSTLLLAMSK
ncbi:Zona pellucida sperm-binding protein 2 [Dissostichus eleginoides]|uniref:Zona pellucida sperm-binding protein 2 n=1 Tax=Dissostichus eleginoides TaxID=100907 RepID=A0AAD9BWP5_DISEL|nr:Zona pellucida sperm-binding protein 2 [Dissostichus eleginoides]